MSRLSAPAYDIARSTGVCAATGAPIGPGDAVVVALRERAAGEEGFDRLDFLPAAWEALSAQDRAVFDGRRVFAHWRAVTPEPNAKPRALIGDDALLDLFEQTGDAGADGDVRRLAFRFVLALILCRRRLLVLEPAPGAAASGAGSEPLHVRRRTRKDEPPAPLIIVEDPGLDRATIALAAEQLGAAIRGEA